METNCRPSNNYMGWLPARSGFQLWRAGNWFKEIVTEYTLTTRGLKADDLEEWLNSVLYTEFNLILEDESVYPTSVFLLEALGYLRHNDRVHLERLMSTLPSVDAVREVCKNSGSACVVWPYLGSVCAY
ncbi:hypothetical protein OSTOST_01846 [Ostertagia ostertagi]